MVDNSYFCFFTVSECKDKWRNLRSVFVRHLKPAASGSGANKKKPYYLSEAMKFTLPFIRTLGTPEGNLPEVVNEPLSTPTVSQQLSDDSQKNTCLTDEEEEETTMATSLSPPLASDVHNLTNLVAQDDLPQTSKPVSSPTSTRKRKRNTLTDVDKSFKDYMDAKKGKIVSEMKDPKGKKIFLLSLLPEIEPLTDAEMRLFRRQVLRLIDDIRDNQTDGFQAPMQRTHPPSQYSSYPSSSYSSPHGDAASLHQESQMSPMDEQELTTSQNYYQVVREVLDPSNFQM